ncbi:MAG: ABC transporter ATP-binding protein [Candidatus Odinarchaeota archaeon]
MKNEIIEFKEVTKYYKFNGFKQTILDGFTFQVYKNELVLLKGASGSGKSTILNLIMGIEKPNEGAIFINHFDNDRTEQIRTNITVLSERELIKMRKNTFGIIFQFFNLDPLLTVLENVYYPHYILSPVKKVNSFEEKAISFLESLDIVDRANHFPSELSSGEKQRVSICRALFNNPAILLADEPTGNLDEENSKKIFELLWNLKNELQITVIIATHANPDIDWKPRVIDLYDMTNSER